MTLRVSWAGLPLAVLVAVLAHVAGFGSSHAPGNGHATGLLVALGLALALLVASVFLLAAAGGSGAARSVARPGSPANVLGLATLGAAVLLAIEIAEGHAALAGSLPALAALLPIAALVALVARHAHCSLDAAGARCRAGLRRAAPRIWGGFAAYATYRVDARSAVRRDVSRGRAPPRYT